MAACASNLMYKLCVCDYGLNLENQENTKVNARYTDITKTMNSKTMGSLKIKTRTKYDSNSLVFLLFYILPGRADPFCVVSFAVISSGLIDGVGGRDGDPLLFVGIRNRD